MADDDIKIGTAQGPAAPPPGTSPTPQGTQGAAQGSSANPPTPPAPTTTAPVQGQPATPTVLPATPAAPAAATPPPSPKKPAGFSLEDEAMMAQQQTVAAPPDKYAVPAMVKDKFPDLVQLIKETESMNDEERDYWFQILPIMTEEQIRKFRDILLNEKNQLKKLDKEYESELNRLNEKHMLEWKEFEMREKRKAIQTAETKSQEEEKAAEEELLRRLSQH